MFVLLLAAVAGVSVAASAEEDWAARIDRRVESWRPQEAERRLDAIGWARSIRPALELAREHGRPVFLFTLDGRMETGRQ